MDAQPPLVDSKTNGRQTHSEPQFIIAKNPATGEVLGQVPIATSGKIQQAIAEARLGQVAWAGIGLEQRLAFLRALLAACYHNRERIIDTLAAETGKVRRDAMIESFASLELLDNFVRASSRVLTPKPVPVRIIPYRRHFVERRPFGVVLVISPWNFPFWLSMSPIVAALVTGNSVVYKPSEYSTQLGELIDDLIAEAGIPSEVFHTLHGYGDVGAALIQARPDKICFTGSVATGRKVAQAAGEHLIPVTLELGGKDVAIVLEDADIERSAEGIVWSGMFNAGQACASMERVLVNHRVADDLVRAIKCTVERYVHVHSESNQAQQPSMGAITTPAQLKIIEDQVNEALEAGAYAVTGGQRVDSAGQFFEPTILTDVTPEMRVTYEETFGPVIVISSFDSEEKAIQITNDSAYGLTASVWTQDKERGLRIGRQLKVGNVSINEHFLISGTPELPWGGVKDSGYGRTQGEAGLFDMTYAQAMTVDRFPMPRAFELFWYPYNAFKRDILQRIAHLLYGPTLRDKLRALFPRSTP